MTRSRALIAVLILLALAWGTLFLRDRQRHNWIAAAGRGELEKYVAGHPDQSEALFRLSGLLRTAGETAQAEKLARRAVELDPQNEGNWVEFSRSNADDKECIAALQRYLKEFPASGMVMAELARRMLQAGDAEGARALAEKAAKLSPDSPDALRSLGLALAAQRRAPEAEKALRTALSLRDDTETRLALARILIPLQRYDEIKKLCSPIVMAVPSAHIPAGLRARALLYHAGGRLYDPLTTEEIASVQLQMQEADSLSATLPAEERFLPPYFLGESFLRSGKPKEAIPCLERSVTLGPMFPGSLYSLARALRLSGDIAKADAANARHARLSRILGELEMYNNRLDQRPDDADAMLRLAGVLAEAGNASDAARIYRQLISRGNHVEAAKRGLKDLSLHR